MDFENVGYRVHVFCKLTPKEVGDLIAHMETHYDATVRSLAGSADPRDRCKANAHGIGFVGHSSVEGFLTGLRKMEEVFGENPVRAEFTFAILDTILKGLEMPGPAEYLRGAFFALMGAFRDVAGGLSDEADRAGERIRQRLPRS